MPSTKNQSQPAYFFYSSTSYKFWLLIEKWLRIIWLTSQTRNIKMIAFVCALVYQVSKRKAHWYFYRADANNLHTLFPWDVIILLCTFYSTAYFVAVAFYTQGHCNVGWLYCLTLACSVRILCIYLFFRLFSRVM